ncbi:MAG: anhydro-N-acetylmuramic acid kinase [Cyclonatronaceae bacterium]
MSQNLVLSCLSGTSRDGLDIGLCHILQLDTRPGRERFGVELLETATVAFPARLSATLSALCFSETAGVPAMMAAHTEMGRFIGSALCEFMKTRQIAPKELLCIASHGQTLFHQAQSSSMHPARTLQIGEADCISRMTGVPVAADFRQAHIAAGGEGAPLAPILDYYSYRPARTQAPRVLINLGGIANMTLLRPGGALSDLIYGDTGPANILSDQAVERFMPNHEPNYDAGGRLASSGKVHPKWLKLLCAHLFFSHPLPKSTGPEVFHLDWAISVARRAGIPWEDLPLPDVLATLCELSAITLAKSIRQALGEPGKYEVYGSGGGMRNHFLARRIGHHLGLDGALPGIEKLGGSADFKEAALFGLLGFFRHQRFRIPLFGGQRPVLLGKLSEA